MMWGIGSVFVGGGLVLGYLVDSSIVWMKLG